MVTSQDSIYERIEIVSSTLGNQVPTMSQYTRREVEKLEAFLATQALLAVESVDTPE